jgi:hypothetical protein
MAAYNAASVTKPSLPEETGLSYPIRVCCLYATWTCSFQQKTNEYAGGRNRGMRRVQRRYRADDLQIIPGFEQNNHSTAVQMVRKPPFTHSREACADVMRSPGTLLSVLTIVTYGLVISTALVQMLCLPISRLALIRRLQHQRQRQLKLHQQLQVQRPQALQAQRTPVLSRIVMNGMLLEVSTTLSPAYLEMHC